MGASLCASVVYLSVSKNERHPPFKIILDINFYLTSIVVKMHFESGYRFLPTKVLHLISYEIPFF